jgi:hypothetical protein
MGILLVINVFLFVSTLVKINAFKKENQATLRSKDNSVNSSALKENLKFDTQRYKHANINTILLLIFVLQAKTICEFVPFDGSDVLVRVFLLVQLPV